MPTCDFHQNEGIQMSYLKEFQSRIESHDYPAVLRLWEEYCSSDEIDHRELIEILRALKSSDMAEGFGRQVEKIFSLWKLIESAPQVSEIFKLIVDIQTTNEDALREMVLEYLQKKYSNLPHFNEKMRLAGLKNKEPFQGSVSNFELLAHMEKGKYVFHTGGWGVGEIIDVSLIRQQLSVEFDYVPGKKDISFQTAFKTLIPIPDDHFLALRFGSPDILEEKAKENPAEVFRLLLRDLGPKTAAEIKDELCDLVIPSKEWTRWWQNARAKIKKDTMVESPEDAKEPFRLRQTEVKHEERLRKALEKNPDAATLIQMVYSFLKDFPEILKNAEFKAALQTKLTEILSLQEITSAQELQILFFLQDFSSEKESSAVSELIKKLPSIEELSEAIEIIAFKKRVLVEARRARPDWKEIFLRLLCTSDQATVRDYILSELLSAETLPQLKNKLEELAANPGRYPETFLWYFQKIMQAGSTLPFADKPGKTLFFESFLVLLSIVEQNPEQRELVKKMHSLLSAGRYAIIRQIMQDASLDTCKEFLLLSTKCHSLSDHDIKIFHSLAEVVHPSLGKTRKKQEASSSDNQVIWTSNEGYQKLQQRIQQIATVETIENAKEIETARAHGDLRENAEFKAALEKRASLQSEVKSLSDQLNRARIITKEDISKDEVGIGTIVACKKKNGDKISFTLLGPWDADPDKNILSFQSKLAQAMKGLTVGEKFQFQGEEYSITGIESYLEKR